MCPCITPTYRVPITVLGTDRGCSRPDSLQQGDLHWHGADVPPGDALLYRRHVQPTIRRVGGEPRPFLWRLGIAGVFSTLQIFSTLLLHTQLICKRSNCYSRVLVFKWDRRNQLCFAAPNSTLLIQTKYGVT